MKIERILIATFILAELSLFFAIPFGEEAVTISCLILSLGYLILGNRIFKRKENNPDVQFRVFAGIMFFLFTIGMLFRLKVWPGGRMILLMAFFLTISYLCVSFLLIVRNKVQSKKLKPIIFRLLFSMAIACLLYFASGRAILRFQYMNNPERGEKIIEILEYRESLIKQKNNH